MKQASWTSLGPIDLFLPECSAIRGTDDVYLPMTELGDWVVCRRSSQESHGTTWSEEAIEKNPALMFVTTDVGKICFVPVTKEAARGQYLAYDGKTSAGAPALRSASSHFVVVDTEQPDSTWIQLAKVSDFGFVLEREAGRRVEFLTLVREDADAIIAASDSHDECRHLYKVSETPISLPSGKVCIADILEDLELQPSFVFENMPGKNIASLGAPAEGVSTGIGAGAYPVIESRDQDGKMCRITVLFHPRRLSLLQTTFPPTGISSPPADDGPSSPDA
eukprot:GEMP01036586.1.p1 GENE.GEMP01036586.1~~GEMP01036586.1.p1  ORF type:complete len:278 (+),score=49.27 GEMP01036586.1:124-957(+)